MNWICLCKSCFRLLALLLVALSSNAQVVNRFASSVDANRDGYADAWRVITQEQEQLACLSSDVTLPMSFARRYRAQWLGAIAADEVRYQQRFDVPLDADLRSIELGLVFSATAPAAIFVNDTLLAQYTQVAANEKHFYQAKGQAVYRRGVNVLEFRFTPNDHARLNALLFLEGYWAQGRAITNKREGTLRDLRLNSATR